MSLRDKLRTQTGTATRDVFSRYGLVGNPFPSASQTANNPHRRLSVDDDVETRIVSFLRDNKSQVVVIQGTQGVGKTNFLNFFENEIRDVLSEVDGYYVVRYLADPEASFEGTIRRLFQELGVEHLTKVAANLGSNPSALEQARSQDMRFALTKLMTAHDQNASAKLMMEWLLGFRVLKSHREALDVQFRLDTVESKTAAFRDLVYVSSQLGILKGIFLLLDELEKQDGVLGPTAVVRYLSSMRAIIDALPNHLFMMIAITPDAMRRYSTALPAFRSRLQNQVTLLPLSSPEEAATLAKFYVDFGREEAAKSRSTKGGNRALITAQQIEATFDQLLKLAEKRGDKGVRQREFLHELYLLAERAIQSGQPHIG
jgi:P-loop Domain of unknown function (DUF2791)